MTLPRLLTLIAVSALAGAAAAFMTFFGAG